MKAETLRKSILQWAVEGKLVPQLDCELAVEQIGEAPEDVPFLIPEKWKWVQLKKLVVPTKQKIPNSEFNYLDVSSVNSSTREIRAPKRISPESSPSRARKIVKQGMVLFSTVRPYLLNTVVIDSIEPGIETIASTAFATFSCNENLNNRYVWFLFQSPYFIEYVKSKQKGAAYPAISDKDFYSVPIPLPPIQEQRLIVQKLNELLPLVESYGKEQEALEKLEKELPGKLRASLLNEAIQGKLVPQLDSEPQVKQLSETLEDVTFAIPEKWKWAKLSEVATKIQYGYTASASNSGSARLLRITDIQDGQVEWNSTPYCSPTASEIKKFELKTGDILVARTGGTIGKSFLVQNTPSEPSVFASYLIRISPETQLISPNFLKFFLESPYYWTQLKDNSRGTGQPNVNAKALGNLRLPLPPLEEQRRIVEKLNALFKDLDRLTG